MSDHKQAVNDVVAALQKMKADNAAAIDAMVQQIMAMPSGVMAEVNDFLNQHEQSFKDFMQQHFGS